LNLRPGTSPPDYGRLLENPGGFYYGTLAVTAPEPATFLLLSLGLLVVCGKTFRRRTPSSRRAYFTKIK
jgi:hypothetical protein